MRKKLFSLVLIFLMLFAYMPQMAAVAYADDTYEGTAYISLSDDGKFVVSDGENSDVVMAHLAVPLQTIAEVDLAEWDLEQYSYTDYNTNEPDPGAPTVLKLYLYLLKHYYGSAGDGEALRASGAPHSFFMEHFWGHDCNLLYYVNGNYPLFESGWGATADGIILHDGDFVDVAMYTDWGFYTDGNAGFNYFVESDSEPEDGEITFEYNAVAGTPLTVKVARGMGDVTVGQDTAFQAADDLNLHYGSEIDVDDESDLFLEDGAAEITFDEAGTYYVWVDGGLGESTGEPCSCPAVAKVNVEAAASTEALSIYNATDDVKLEVSEVVGWNPAYCVENNVFPTYITELERGKDLRIVENPQILKREDTSWGGIQVATPNGYDGSYLDGFAAIDAIDGCDFRAQAGDLAGYIHKASEFAILFGDETACLPAYPGNQDDEILLLKVDDAITDEQAAYYDEVEWENSAWTYYIFVKIADPPAPANNAPTLAEGVAATAESEATAGEAYTLDLSTIFTDVDGDELTYTVSVNEGEAVAAAASYSYTPEAAGTYTLVFKANDGTVESEDTYTVTLTVKAAQVGTDPTTIYTNGVDGSGWVAYRDSMGTVDSVTLSGVTVKSYEWNGNTCEVLLTSDVSIGAAATFTTVITGRSASRCYMAYNGSGKQGATTSWSVNLNDVETTVTLMPYYSTTSLSGTTKTIKLTIEEEDHGAVTGIEITTPPAKTTYYSTETFDPTGMVVTATYEDGFTKVVQNKKLTYAPEKIAADTTAIVISYEGKTATQPVTVTALPDYVAMVNYVLSTGSVDRVDILDANGNGIAAVVDIEVKGQNINVVFDRSIDPAAQVKAVFTLTQNESGYPFLSSNNTMRAANYKTNTYATTLSGGSGSAKAYLYNHSPSAIASDPDATFTVTYATQNNLPTLRDGVSAAVEERVMAESPYELDLGTIFEDADGDALTYTVAVNGAAAVSADAAYSFTTDQMGTYTLVFKANDGYGTSAASYTVTLTVERKPGTYYITHTSGTGYATEGAEGSASPVNEGESYTVKLNVTAGYVRGENFAVKANGTALTEDSEGSNLFTISNIAADQTITVEGIEEKKPVIIAPAGSVITAGRQLDYFRYEWYEPIATETLADGRIQNTYDIKTGTNMFYRIQNPNGVTYWNFISGLARGAEFEVTATDIYLNDANFKKDTVYHNFEYNNLDLGDIYLNINEKGYLALNPGATYELNSFRNWYAIESFTNAQVALPDFHYEVMDINGDPSDLVAISPDTHNTGLATLTAGQESGLAIVKVTYDAMIHKQGYASGYGAGGADSTRFSHIWPETSGIFVVTVGEPDGSGIGMGMTINVGTHAGKVAGDNIDAEHDPLYYVGEEGASYTFSPDSGTTVSIARSTVTPNGLTYNGFTTEGVTTDEDGKVTVTGLTDGRHIVRAEKDGTANYQILTARQINVTFTDAEGTERAADYQWKPGDAVTITVSQIDSPQEKFSGYYNNSFTVAYKDELENTLSDTVGHGYGQYNFSSTTHSFTATIPDDWEKNTFAFTNGAVKMGGFSGGAAGSHRTCRYLTGKGMTTGTAGQGVLGSMPDIVLNVQQNTPPHLAEGIAETAIAETSVGTPYTLDLTQIFTDDENDELTYQVSVNDADPVAAAANYSYEPEDVGQVTLVFSANDGSTSSTETYQVTLTIKAQAVPADCLTTIDENCDVWPAYVALSKESPELYLEYDLRPAYQVVLAEANDLTITESADTFEQTGEHDVRTLTDGEVVPCTETGNAFTLKAEDYQQYLGKAQTVFAETHLQIEDFNIDPESQIVLLMIDGPSDPELATYGMTGYYLIITIDEDAEPTGTQHQWDDGVITTKPSFTEKGVKTYTCANNPSHTYTEELGQYGFTVQANGEEITAIEIVENGFDASYEDYATGDKVESLIPLAIVTLPADAPEQVEITLNDYTEKYQNYIYTKEPDATGYTQYNGYGFGDEVADYTYIAEAGKAYLTDVLPGDQVYRVQTAYDENWVSDNLYAIAFAKPVPVTTVSVDFTSQSSGGFLHAPQFGKEVSSDLAESYGYTDEVDGVSALDVLVAAHEVTYGDDFTPATAEDYLTMGTTGAPTMQFGIEGNPSASYEASYMGMFFLNHGWPNDGTIIDDRGAYRGTTVTTQEVKDGDLVEFFFNESGFLADTYNWFTDADGEYSRTFTTHVGEDLDLVLTGAWVPDPAQLTKDEMDLVNFDRVQDDLDGVQIYTVNLETGALTEIEDAVTDVGDVTLNFATPGTYTITAYTDEDYMNTYIMTLTKVVVEGHDLEATEAKAATCEEAGNSAYWTCNECGKYFSDAEGTAEIAKDSWIIPALGHDWDDGNITTHSTFTKKGEIVYTCQRDASHTMTEEIDKLLGFTVKVDDVEITDIEITDGGYDASYTDWMTGNKIESHIPLAVVTLPSCGTGDVEITLNDYNESGYQNYYYTREPDATGETQYVGYGFGDQIDQYNIVAAPNKAYETAVAPADQVIRVQTAYDTAYRSDNLFAIAFVKPQHELTATPPVSASCEEAGNSAYWTCSECGKYFSDAEGTTEIAKDSWIIPATGHDWDVEGIMIQWDENNNATAIMTCKNDPSHEYTETVKPTAEVTKQPTCTEWGETTYTATFSNTEIAPETLILEDVEPLGHSYGAWTKLDDKQHQRVCANDATHIEKKAHSWDSGKVTKAATEDAEGVKTYTCTVCKATKTEVIPKLDHKHNLVKTAAKAATCTEAGNKAYWTCSKCGKVYSDAKAANETTVKAMTIKATGHKLTKTAAKAATCTTAGNKAYWTCSKCGKVYSDVKATKETTVKAMTIKATGHKLTKTAAKAATCGADGNKAYYTCSACKKVFSDAKGTKETTKAAMTIKATGKHTWDKGKVTKEATTTATGVKTYTCTVCKATKTETIPKLKASYERLSGQDRYETSLAIAEKFRTEAGVSKFKVLIVADGINYPDALAGSYLGLVKDCPVISVAGMYPNHKGTVNAIAYIKKNLEAKGQIYIVGGTGSVDPAIEKTLKAAGFQVKRLAGSNRYLTNLEILKEAKPVAGAPYIVCTGADFGDALSASATGRPLLLVAGTGKSLTAEQKAYLQQAHPQQFFVIGDQSVTSNEIVNELKTLAPVTRVGSGDAYSRSLAVAKKFFTGNQTLIQVADGRNFPDGLCGGALAARRKAPLLLSNDESTAVYNKIADYAKSVNAGKLTVFGGPGSVADQTAKTIIGLN